MILLLISKSLFQMHSVFRLQQSSLELGSNTPADIIETIANKMQTILHLILFQYKSRSTSNSPKCFSLYICQK
jgi:hypothetical protein